MAPAAVFASSCAHKSPHDLSQCEYKMTWKLLISIVVVRKLMSYCLFIADLFKNGAVSPVVNDHKLARIPYKLDNKYYTCEIDLCLLADSKSSLGQELMTQQSSVEAVVIYFDNTVVRFLASIQFIRS
jgi:hypothetical protein